MATILKIYKNNFKDVDLNLLEDETFDILTTGKAPNIFTLPLNEDIASSNTTFSFEYFCPTGVDFIELSFYLSKDIIPIKTIRNLGSTEGWIESKVDSKKRND